MIDRLPARDFLFELANTFFGFDAKPDGGISDGRLARALHLRQASIDGGDQFIQLTNRID